MPAFSMRDVNFSFGGPPLLEGINVQVDAGERVCLLGRNGCGKSTLLSLIQGELEIDSGEMAFQPNIRITTLKQSVPLGMTGRVFSVVADGLGDAGKLLTEYHNISHDDESDERLERLHHQLDALDSWQKLNVIETAISQVGLDADADFVSLSAGLKRRVMLARALAAEPDMLILDEPTNHLDVDAIDWLEDFLLRYGKTLLFVTHDRMFLRKLATRIIEIDRGSLSSWDCGYDDYLKRKQQLLDSQQKQWALFDKKLAEEERWIRKGIQARRVRNEGRVRSLKKMRQVHSDRRYQDGRVKIEVNAAQRSGDLVAAAKGVDFSYGDSSELVIKGLETTIFRGDRIGIIGPNGSGKTTLLRLLLGELKPDDGNVRLGSNVQCAYFDQLHGQLDPDKSLVENIGEGYDTIDVNGRKKQVVAYLSDFMFTPYKSRALVSSLSGGERNRLQIAKVFTKMSNVLVLDEPTNDLDVETLELLEEMLIEYPGTVLIVSHDRAFLNNVVTSTLVLEEGGKVKEYAGGYDDWQRLQKPKSPVVKAKPESKPKPVRQKTAKLSYKQKQEFEKLPDRIEELESQIAQLHENMAGANFYKQDGNVIAETNAKLEGLQKELETAYARWEALAELE